MATIFRPPGISRLPSLTYTRPHEAQNLLSTTLAELIPIGSLKRDWQSRANIVRVNDWKEYPNTLTTTLLRPFLPQQDILTNRQIPLGPFDAPNLLSTVLAFVPPPQNPFIPFIDNFRISIRPSEIFEAQNLLPTVLSIIVSPPFLPNIFYADPLRVQEIQVFDAVNAILVLTATPPPATNRKRVFGFVTG